jgi:hypothetical protein
MPHEDWFILLVMGGFFVLLGLGGIFWGRREEKSYFNALSSRDDVREYLEHWPQRPEPGALKMGGWVAITLGVFMLALGVFFLLWS